MNQLIAYTQRRVPTSRKVWLCVLGATTLFSIPMLASLRAQTAPAAESNTNYPPNSSTPKNFEGVWWPVSGMGGGGMGAGGPPAAGGGQGGPGGAPGGAPGGGGPAAQVEGTTLQCTPVQRLSGSGGGMTTLIVQSDKQLVMVSEEDMDIARKIYIGGKHPDQLVPQPNGHSIGHWEGNTLVVDSIGYSGKDGKDNGQHIVERFTKTGNTLTSEISITDKSGNKRSQTQTWAWRPDLQFNENVCEEGFDRYQIINGELDNPNVPPSREDK